MHYVCNLGLRTLDPNRKQCHPCDKDNPESHMNYLDDTCEEPIKQQVNHVPHLANHLDNTDQYRIPTEPYRTPVHSDTYIHPSAKDSLSTYTTYQDEDDSREVVVPLDRMEDSPAKKQEPTGKVMTHFSF